MFSMTKSRELDEVKRQDETLTINFFYLAANPASTKHVTGNDVFPSSYCLWCEYSE